MNGIYIHIPFCVKRCIYCDFYSTTYGEKIQNGYVNALCNELIMRKNYLPTNGKISSIYIGGGTPSRLSATQLVQIFSTISQHFSISKDAEITMEMNPDDVTIEYMTSLLGLPINRISLGVQTFDDKQLKFLNRRHTSQQVYDAINIIRQFGITNISIDLIYGLPSQTLQQWNNDVDKALSLPITHLSAYALIYEENTPLYNMLKEGKVREANEELSLAMFESLIDKTKTKGFEHYEISNFALPKLRAKHNSGYWHGMLYLGCGPGAHSYNGNSRQWNNQNVMQYIECNGNVTEAQLFEVEELTPEMKYNELLLTSLRTSDGLDLSLLKENQKRDLLNMAKTFIENSTLRIVNNHLCLTRKGVFISDGIISNLMV